MITEPNYQPEPPSNQPSDIDDGMPLTGRDLLKQLHNDLLEALAYWDSHPCWLNVSESINADEKLKECYIAYKHCLESLEEM